jgi:endonuclease YncB( thermonuclease family)
LRTCELSPSPKAGDLGVFFGSFVRVIDGDTLEAKVQGVVMQFRLAEVDAPESDQPYGDKSTQELQSLLVGKELVLVPIDTDRYGRTVAFVWVANMCVNKEAIRRGAAWFYDEYSYSDALYHVEEQARASRAGLWALSPNLRVPPHEWRAEKR